MDLEMNFLGGKWFLGVFHYSNLSISSIMYFRKSLILSDFIVKQPESLIFKKLLAEKEDLKDIHWLFFA